MSATESGAMLRFGGSITFTAAGVLLLLLAAIPAPAQWASLSQVGEVVQLSPRLQELTFTTPALMTPYQFMVDANPTGETKVRVLLPHGYDPNGTRRYPVLYLFHGGGENQAAWTSPGKKGDAEGLTAELPLIVVMPNGGIAGGYADWYNNGAFGAPAWKTYHLDQLIPWIDAHYRTIQDRSARATAGLSMGGGGLRYAAQRPDLIGITASFSGDIDITQPTSDWRGMGAVVSKMIWGDFATQEIRWRGVNGPDLAKNLSNTDVSIFVGDSGRPEGTYIHGAAVAVHQRLEELAIPHQYKVYPGMKHDWITFNKELADWLPRLMQQFRNPATTPSTFSYSAIAPRYSIYGWTVQMRRDAIEFSALEVTDSRNFSVIGSGSATIDTPSLIGPGVQFRVKINDLSKSELSATFLICTDTGGHLSFPVALGPANPYQQYTAAANTASTGPSSDQAPFLVSNNGSRFYRTQVTIAATPSGLCHAVRIFTTDKKTNSSLCNLMQRIEKDQAEKGVTDKHLQSFRDEVTKRAGRTLTKDHAETLIKWADTL